MNSWDGWRRTKPLFSLPARLGMAAIGAFVWVWALQGLGSVADAKERQLYRGNFDYDPGELPFAWRVLRAISPDETGVLVWWGFAAILFIIVSRKPRLAAAVLMAAALIYNGIFIAHFGTAWMDIQALYNSPTGWSGSLAAISAATAPILGVITLIIIAFAEALDREAASRQANRQVELDEARSPESLQRAKRHRDLAALLAGGAFRPWMAVARVVPVVMLPAMCALVWFDEASKIREGELRSPLLATQAPPPHPGAPSLTVMLDPAGTASFGDKAIPFEDGHAWPAAVEAFRKARQLSGADARIELAPDSAVDLQKILDALGALKRAGFRDIVLADNGD